MVGARVTLRRTPLARRTRLKTRRKVSPGDAAARDAVMERAQGRCEWCQYPAPLEWAHVFSRGYPAIRHELDNGMGLCGPCHRMFDANRKAGRAWWEVRIGPERMARLREVGRPR